MSAISHTGIFPKILCDRNPNRPEPAELSPPPGGVSSAMRSPPACRGPLGHALGAVLAPADGRRQGVRVADALAAGQLARQLPELRTTSLSHGAPCLSSAPSPAGAARRPARGT